MADVFRIVTAEGHEYDFHGGVDALKETYPGAVITGRRMVNAVGEGTYEPYTIAKAQAAGRKAADGDKPARYKDMKVDDLRGLLGERSIVIPEGVKKDDLITALEAHDSGATTFWEVADDGDGADAAGGSADGGEANA